MKRSLVAGFVASASLLSLYGITMFLLSGWEAMIAQFAHLWYLMIPLAIGFGIQIALFMKLRELRKQQNSTMVAAGGTSAGVAMLACCAHHVTDVLPILGLSAISTVLVAWQKPILVISLFVNGAGIVTLWRKTHE